MATKHANSPSRSAQRGVTLVEMAVVIAVTVVVAATAAPSLARFVEARRLDAAATQLAGDIQLVGTEAVARNRPIRLSIHGDGDRRVCRFAADRDGSGAIDANIEHPADYRDVSGGLTAQNFLVVRGSQACPAAPDDGILSASQGTVQQQP